jgi:hypothetical protein
MRAFTYERVTDVRSAVTAVSRPGARFISGGTNLLDLMKLEIERPSHVVDISHLPLADIDELPDGGLRIGAQATNSGAAADARAIAAAIFGDPVGLARHTAAAMPLLPFAAGLYPIALAPAAARAGPGWAGPRRPW